MTAIPTAVPKAASTESRNGCRHCRRDGRWDGGPDGRYSLPPLEGGRAGFADLRQFGVSADFLGQVVHTTADRNFRDTINIAVKPSAAGKGTTVRAFSTSNIVRRPV